MYEGSLVAAGWEAVVTLQQLVILADKHGIVDMSLEAIARLTMIPVKHLRIGLAALEQPDPDSRTPGEDGRRIVRLSDTRSWGWRIVNHAHYRKIRSEEERREYHRNYQRNRRAKTAVNSDVNTSTPRQQNQPIAGGSKQEAVGRKQKARNPHNSGGPNLRVKGERLYAEILAHKVTTATPSGARSHIPKEFIETLPGEAQRAFQAIGGAGAVIAAEGDATGRRVLQGKFGEHYELECSGE